MNSSDNAIKLAFEPLRELAAVDFGVGFTAIGDPLLYPARMNIFTNNTETSIYISLNGVDNHFEIAAGTAFVADWSSNKSNQGWCCADPSWYPVLGRYRSSSNR
jgi:hypothetical protein